MKTENVQISCPNIFCFHNLSQKCFDEFLLSKTRKKKCVFCHFRPLDGIEITQKHRFMTRSVQLPIFRHLTRLSSLSGHETVTGKVFFSLFQANFVGKSGLQTSLGVDGWVRCRFLRFGTLRVKKRHFQLISTPSSGQKIAIWCPL